MSRISRAPNLYLVGFMAAGKTTLGRHLARMTDRRFVDLDEEFERRERQSIAAFFREKGEEAFRDAERALIREYARRSGLVIAVGGGGFCSRKNQHMVRASGIAIWIEVPFDVLVARLEGGKERPLNASPETLVRLYQQRLPHYQSADLRILLSHETPEQAAMKIIEALEAHKQMARDRP